MSPAPQVPRKWRPSLALIVYAVLLVVLGLPSGLVILVRAWSGRGPSTLEIGVLVASLVVTLVIAYVLTRAVSRPMAALVERSREIGQGGRDAIKPLDSYGTAELATLSQGFLDLASRLMDRTEYMRSFAAHVSHELKSPLTAIKGSAELMRDEGEAMTSAERHRFLDHIVADADRLTRLLARLRSLAEAELPTARGETTLATVLPGLRQQVPGVDIVGEGQEIIVALPTEALSIVLAHLAENSAQHGAGRLVINVQTSAEGSRLTIADDGAGISEGNRNRVFQPFFTTRREMGGTGMGLDIVRAMLQAQNADIELLRSERGASFQIIVPAV